MVGNTAAKTAPATISTMHFTAINFWHSRLVYWCVCVRRVWFFIRFLSICCFCAHRTSLRICGTTINTMNDDDPVEKRIEKYTAGSLNWLCKCNSGIYSQTSWLHSIQSHSSPWAEALVIFYCIRARLDVLRSHDNVCAHDAKPTFLPRIVFFLLLFYFGEFIFMSLKSKSRERKKKLELFFGLTCSSKEMIIK